MILLDTNALLWLVSGHKRAKPLLAKPQKLVVSPVTLWELATLAEVGRVQLTSRVEDDERWVIDDPSSRALFAAAETLGWTRDPFDRLLVAHTLVRRFKFATGDHHIIDHLQPGQLFAL